MPEPRFTFVFAAELHERLVWFVRLRWLAVAGLAGASWAGPHLGLPVAWPSLFAIAAFVALYNLILQYRLESRRHVGIAYGDLRAIAIAQMVTDLTALMLTVHFTGGLQSPLLVFFAFHMAIGTIIISTRMMYLLAGITSVGASLVFVARVIEVAGLGATAGGEPELLAWGRNLLALVVAMFGIVYLTGSVTRRFTQRSIELYRTTKELFNRTRQLQYLLDDMERIELRKSHYMRISAHHLRSPLATVKTSLQVLAEGYVEPSSERGRRLLEGVAEAVNRLLAIVNDLLELAKVREGRGRNAPWSRDVDLRRILCDVLGSLQPFAEERNVVLAPELADDAVVQWGIPPDLLEAFENLIHNGIKYSHPGGMVAVRLTKDEKDAVVRVVDEGIGIPEESRELVFLEFVRAPNARRHSPEGTGLGLAIVREVVQAHGGEVRVESSERGSIFTVRLPRNRTPLEVERLAGPPAEEARPPSSPPGEGAQLVFEE